jgi:hypothetical protein
MAASVAERRDVSLAAAAAGTEGSAESGRIDLLDDPIERAITMLPPSTRLSIRAVGAVDPVAPPRPHRRSLRSPALQRRP